MKKCIVSAIAGALCMVLVLYSVTMIRGAWKARAYEHIDFQSTLPQEDCFLCGNKRDSSFNPHWDEDNVCLINLNTFDWLLIEINRYKSPGALIEEPAGYMQTRHLMGENTSANAFVFPDNGYAHIQITGVQYSISREAIQSNLCQNCLDTINCLWFDGHAPAEYAIISLTEQTIQPLLRNRPWFSSGDYGIDCEFKEGGNIDLLVHFCPSRYE